MSDFVQIPISLLDDIKEFFDQRSDIRDTSDGTAPNKAMELLERIEREAVEGYSTFGGGGGVGGYSNPSGSAGEPSNPSQRVQYITSADGFVQAIVTAAGGGVGVGGGASCGSGGGPHESIGAGRSVKAIHYMEGGSCGPGRVKDTINESTDGAIRYCGYSGRQCLRSDPRVCLNAGRCMGI